MDDKSIKVKPVPPKEAIKFFESKGYKIGFDWRDIEREEHAYAFTVAKVTRNDLLQDIRGAVDLALKEGRTFAEFSKDLTPVLQEKGWWGKKMVVDPKTGEEKLVQLGSSRRLEIIYDTNMRTARAAGRWEQIQRTKKTFPYLRYDALMDGRTRPAHAKLNDIILPVDHPFWDQFYPPNGWKCRCWVVPMNDRMMERRGLKLTDHDPTPPTRPVINKRTGEIRDIPRGIDAGFDYNVGKERMKSLNLPPLNKPLDVPYSGASALLPMLAPRTLPKSIIMPDNLKNEQYVRAFMDEFGSKDGKPVVFKDVAGENIVISEDLFKTATGRWKLDKDERRTTLQLLAKTIKNPDEIWLTWEEYPKGRMTLRRRYIAQWEIEDRDLQALSIFDTTNAGWWGITAFPPDKIQYLLKQRAGSLIWRRKK